MSECLVLSYLIVVFNNFDVLISFVGAAVDVVILSPLRLRIAGIGEGVYLLERLLVDNLGITGVLVIATTDFGSYWFLARI